MFPDLTRMLIYGEKCSTIVEGTQYVVYLFYGEFAQELISCVEEFFSLYFKRRLK